MSEAISVVLVTAPDEAVAARLARTLVEERLAACANLIPGVRSIYRWEGEVHDEPEVLLVLKTSAACLPSLLARVPQLHPASVPEVVELPAGRVLGSYARWVVENSQGDGT